MCVCLCLGGGLFGFPPPYLNHSELAVNSTSGRIQTFCFLSTFKQTLIIIHYNLMDPQVKHYIQSVNH